MFNTLVVDPPWPISMAGKFKDRPQRPRTLPYETMSIEDIKALPVRSVCGDGAHVYLWATNATLRTAFDVFDAWGISYHMTLVMTKPSGIAPALGYVFGTEFCLLGFAGKPMQKFQHIGALNWFSRPSVRGQHSVKPPAFYDMVERMSPGPYGDVFARRAREGWDVWGNEVEQTFVLKQSPRPLM